jgi:hypothetical protein
MRKHNGMRPQDVIILLKIVSIGRRDWQNKDLAAQLYISTSEISESLYRSAHAGLIEANERKTVFTQSLLEFLEHGLHYVFPANIGPVQNGMYTAHSHPQFQGRFKNEIEYVWPDAKGKVRGLIVEPLYPKMVSSSLLDERLYKMAALVDIIRIGRVREWKFAVDELKKLMNESRTEYNPN